MRNKKKGVGDEVGRRAVTVNGGNVTFLLVTKDVSETEPESLP